MKTNGHSTSKKAKTPAFVARAERAFRRVARQVRAEHAKLGLPIVGGTRSKIRLARTK